MELFVVSPTKLVFQDKTYTCVIGRGGFTTSKKEGDGATPIGRFKLRSLRYRPDRIDVPKTRLAALALTPQDGWCDAPNHNQYNQPVSLPFGASHERLWRDDILYNVLVDLGYNDDPPVPGLGSAIFLHVAGLDLKPTEGCVALKQQDLLEVLENCGPETWIDIRPDAA